MGLAFWAYLYQFLQLCQQQSPSIPSFLQTPFCLIGTYRGQKAQKCSEIFIAAGAQLLSAHAGNTDWARMSLGRGPTLPKGTHLNAGNPPRKPILFAGLAGTAESVQPVTTFPIHIPQYMMQFRLNTLLSSAEPVLVGSRTPRSHAQGCKNGAKAKERLSSSSTSLLHFPARASSFLKS